MRDSTSCSKWLYLDKAIAIAPDDNYIFYYKGMALDGGGDYVGAEAAYSKAISNHKKFAAPDDKHYDKDLARFEKALQDLAVKIKNMKDKQ